MKNFFLLGLFACLSLLACQQSQPTKLNKEIFAKVTADVLIIQYTNLNSTQKALLVKKILQKHGVTSEEYLNTKNYYADDPFYWEKVFKRINAILKQKTVETFVMELKMGPQEAH